MAKPGEKSEALPNSSLFKFKESLRQHVEAERAKAKTDSQIKRLRLLSEVLNKFDSKFKQNFALGEYKIPTKFDFKTGQNLYDLIGSVDRVTFEKKKRTEQWWQEKQEVSKLFVTLNNQNKINLSGFYGTNASRQKEVLNIVEKLANVPAPNWEKELKKIRSQDVYSADGALNLLLALQRSLETIDVAKINPRDLPANFLKITLQLADKNGDLKEYRFASIASAETKPALPAVAPPAAAAPSPPAAAAAQPTPALKIEIPPATETAKPPEKILKQEYFSAELFPPQLQLETPKEYDPPYLFGNGEVTELTLCPLNSYPPYFTYLLKGETTQRTLSFPTWDRRNIYSIGTNIYGITQHITQDETKKTERITYNLYVKLTDGNIVISNGDAGYEFFLQKVDTTNGSQAIYTQWKGEKPYSTFIDPKTGSNDKKVDKIEKILIQPSTAPLPYYYSSLDQIKDSDKRGETLNYCTSKTTAEQGHRIFEMFGDTAGSALRVSGDDDYEWLGGNRIILAAALFIKGPGTFLKENGNAYFERGKRELLKTYKTPEERRQLLAAVNHAITSIDQVKDRFANKGKKQLDAMLKKGTGRGEGEDKPTDVWVFKNKQFEEGWNGIQKFCFRQERRVPGFTDWVKGKLSEFSEEIALALKNPQKLDDELSLIAESDVTAALRQLGEIYLNVSWFRVTLYDWTLFQENIPNIERALRAFTPEQLNVKIVITPGKGPYEKIGVIDTADGTKYIAIPYNGTYEQIKEIIEKGLTELAKPPEKTPEQTDEQKVSKRMAQISDMYDCNFKPWNRIQYNWTDVNRNFYKIEKALSLIDKNKLKQTKILLNSNSEEKEGVLENTSGYPWIAIYYGKNTNEIKETLEKSIAEFNARIKTKKKLRELSHEYEIILNCWSGKEYDWEDVEKNLPKVEAALKLIDKDKLRNAHIVLSNTRYWLWDAEGISDTANRGEKVITIDYDEDPEDIADTIKDGLKELGKK